MASVTGRIFDMHRLSTHDGPGLRTTVFLKGCSLSCKWCHNPESIHSYDELQWIGNKCIGCLRCVEACTFDALQQKEGKIVIDRKKCTRCMACTHACPTGAMNKIGEEKSTQAVFDEVMQDQLFYENSGGGMTISGGEPLLQPDFVSELLDLAKENRIHTAIDTALNIPNETVAAIYKKVDLWLIDAKDINLDIQKEFMGASDSLMKKNLLFLLQAIKEEKVNAKIWIRTPLIPRATARNENVKGIGEWLNEINNGAITLWELCTFNNLCGDKYKKLDMDWFFEKDSLLTKAEKEDFYQCALSVSDGSYSVKISGLTL